jgi:hypothetical protein
MSEVWNVYLYNVNGELASIVFDHGIRANAPDATRPELLWVWVYMKNPRPDGLSDSSEFDTLKEVEDKISEFLLREYDAILLGRITTMGRREFYYYGSRNLGFETALQGISSQLTGYKFDCGSQPDPEWTQYLNLLYPSEEQLERMGNRDTLQVMKDKGDDHSRPRDVRRWIYFRSSEDRQKFWRLADDLDYRMVASHEKPEGEMPFCLTIERTQAVTQEKMDEATIELHRFAKLCNGDYDGWEAQVTPGTAK